MIDTNQNENEFVPWNRGAEILGIKRGAFFYLVKTGQVRTQPGRGSRNGRYSLVDIEKVKAQRESGRPRKAHRKKPVLTVIDWLQPGDVLAALNLDRIVYDQILLAEAAVYEAWRHINPHLSMAAFDAKDRSICYAYIGLIPLPEAVIVDILSGKREEVDIKPEEIEGYDRTGGYTLLANSIVVHPDRPDLLYKVLYRMMEEWIKIYPERYIRKIYAQSISTKGDILIQHFFMAPRSDLAYNAFELDLARPAASKVMKWFKEQLEKKAPLPSELQWPPLQ